MQTKTWFKCAIFRASFITLIDSLRKHEHIEWSACARSSSKADTWIKSLLCFSLFVDFFRTKSTWLREHYRLFCVIYTDFSIFSPWPRISITRIFIFPVGETHAKGGSFLSHASHHNYNLNIQFRIKTSQSTSRWQRFVRDLQQFTLLLNYSSMLLVYLRSLLCVLTNILIG